jgi:hypothetical protein
MRTLLGLVGALLFCFLVALAISMVASESGEVVTLRTPEPSTETRLWVVDEDGRQWLRAGAPTSSWLLAIQKNPAVEVERDGKSATYTAVPDAASRDRINDRMAAKYGWADAYIGALFGRDDATPIRLDPR